MKQYVITKINKIYIGFMFKDGSIEEIRSYEDDSLIGNIYVGRVSNIVPNINAAFVDIQKGEVCYMSMEDYKEDKKLKIGDLITVQVTKDSIKTKKATVTSNISINGDYVMVCKDSMLGVSSKITAKERRNDLKKLYNEALSDFENKKKCKNINYGGIIRTRSEEALDENVKKEALNNLCRLDDILYKSEYATAYSCLYHNKAGYINDLSELRNSDVEIITDSKELFDECKAIEGLDITLYDDNDFPLNARFNLRKILEKCIAAKVYLKSGAYLVIEPTEALTVIDVNSGKAIKGNDVNKMQYKINYEAAQEIARQIKLRNLSGIIIIDFISMKSEQLNHKLMDDLADLIKNDNIATQVVDMTRLGLVELTRKKVRKPLHEIVKKI